MTLILLLLTLVTATSAHPYCNAPFITDDYTAIPDADLIHLQMIFRHGDRTPHAPSPTTNVRLWNCSPTNDAGAIPIRDISNVRCTEPSQLTAKGFSQLQAMGRKAREIYVDRLEYLPKVWSAHHVHTRSTHTTRTEESARAFVSSLYPKLWPRVVWNELRPLVHVGTTGDDSLHERTCKPRKALFKKMDQEKEWQDLSEKMHAWVRWHEKVQGFRENSVSLLHVADNIMARYCHGLPLQGAPLHNQDSNAKIPSDVLVAQNMFAAQQTLIHKALPQSMDANRLGYGGFLNEIRSMLKAKASGFFQEDARQWRSEFYHTARAKAGYSHNSFKHDGQAELFFTHDDLFLSVLALLGVDELSWPPYAANLEIELWRKHPRKEDLTQSMMEFPTMNPIDIPAATLRSHTQPTLGYEDMKRQFLFHQDVPKRTAIVRPPSPNTMHAAEELAGIFDLTHVEGQLHRPIPIRAVPSPQATLINIQAEGAPAPLHTPPMKHTSNGVPQTVYQPGMPRPLLAGPPSPRSPISIPLFHPIPSMKASVSGGISESLRDSLHAPYLVRILYNGQPLNVHWCDFKHGCPLAVFLDYTKNMVVKDFEKECRSPEVQIKVGKDGRQEVSGDVGQNWYWVNL